MEQEKQLEQMIVTCLNTAQAMLKEYGLIIPFGIRAFSDSEDLKMNCPGDDNPDSDYDEQIKMVVSELKAFTQKENIAATTLVTGLETDDNKGIGLQIETEMSGVLFVYPYKKEGDEWEIDEPMETNQMFATVFER